MATASKASGPAAVDVVADGGDGARFVRLAAASDDLYVIDAAAGHVRRYILNGLPRAELQTQVMRWKEGADKLIMGDPLDVALVGQRLFIIDSLGSLWSYWGPTYARSLVALRLQSNQGTVVAVALHGADLIALDPAARRLWRYRPDGLGGYDTVPVSLTRAPLAALGRAVCLAVARDALYVLTSAGDVLLLPWRSPDSVRALKPGRPVTGIWTDRAADGGIVASAHAVGFARRDGTISWVAEVAVPGGAGIVDLARSPGGVVYLLTPTRILRLISRAGRL